MRRKKLVTSFYRQLAILLEAGFSLLRALNILSQRVSRRQFQQVVRNLVDRVEKGQSFWEALEQEPRWFPALQVQLLRAGENSGNLPRVLDRLHESGMREIAVRNRMRSSLAYPAVVLVVAVLLIGFLSTTIVPTFSALFEGIHAQLPAPTRALIASSDFVRHQWVHILIGGGLAVVLIRILLTLRAVRYLSDSLKLRFTAFGPLTKEYVVVHTCRTLGMLLQSGINLLKALELTRDASPNLVVARGLEQARDDATRGRGLERPLRQTRIFPSLVVDMIVTAQETGALAENLLHAADIYEEELENKMRLLASMTEPVLVLVVGSVVIFVALSLFLPYIKLLTVMSGGAVVE